ncbi:DNA-damage-repair/toleration protein [Actinidia chinensis var. chinensis]|uniref:DNA-damage-repair/toleration protein n=1 Tax=Actinidia chinensis var. chinensis TaxID=1590841 RepID=A0A2R6RG12_ACTCC|nr:DNA-damage-repair/toleration protein [Actinidia chinensis var. chinensis]
MLGGLYGDLPPPSSTDEDRTTINSSTVWSSSAKMAPSTLRKPAFAPPQTVLKTPLKLKKAVSSPGPPAAMVDDGGRTPAFEPALVGVTSTVVEEYDPARPNDYEEYRREKKKKAAEAEARRELERRRQEEEESEREAAERDRERDSGDSRLNISGEEAWRRRAAMGGATAEVAVTTREWGRVYHREVGDSGVGDWGWWADECSPKNDGQDGVEGRARAREAGAGDYDTADG